MATQYVPGEANKGQVDLVVMDEKHAAQAAAADKKAAGKKKLLWTLLGLLLALIVVAAILIPVLITQLNKDDGGDNFNRVYAFPAAMDGHRAIASDNCDIGENLDLLTPAGLAEASKIYLSGKNSKNDAGVLRNLTAWATQKHPGEIYYDRASNFYGKDPVWVDTHIRSTFSDKTISDGARAEMIEKAARNEVTLKYIFHEIEGARADLAAREVDPATGAPHALDEAAAVYFGTPDNQACTPYGAAQSRATNYAKLIKCDIADTNQAIRIAFNKAYKALIKEDKEEYEKAAAEIEKQIKMTYARGTIEYAKKTDEAGTAAAALKAQAEGYAFFRVLAPWVNEVSPQAATTVMNLFKPNGQTPPQKGIYTAAEDALEPLYPQMGFTLEELGEAATPSNCASTGRRML